jgi:hypothetical protein
MTRSASSTDDLLALLDRERAAFLAQVERVPGARQAERPRPERWSVAEIVEHVARIDAGVGKLIGLKSAEPPTATPEQLAEGRMTPERAARVRSRDERIVAPERVRPTGTLSPEEALAQLAQARTAVRAAFLAADPAVLDGAVHPHPIIGLLTLRSWVELLAHHDARHAQQVAELAEELRRS